MKKTFTVSVTFDVQVGDNPLEVTKKVCDILMDTANTLVYEVEDEDTGEKFIVDLSEETVSPNND
jgi:hypothetical protein